jgi:two-component system response regulator
MLIDDDEDDYFLLKGAFSTYSDQVQLTHQRTATNLMDDLLQLTRLPDLILLDLNLPPLNGLEVLATLKQDARTRQIPVLIWSGSIAQDQLRQCYEGGVSSVLLKSADQHSLVEAVQRICTYWFEVMLLPDNSV